MTIGALMLSLLLTTELTVVGPGELRISSRGATPAIDGTELRLEGRSLTLDLPRLTRLEVVDGATVRIDALQTDTFELKIDHARKVEIDRVDVRRLEVEISGEALCWLRGRVDTQLVRVGGRSSYEARALASQVAEMRVADWGNATVSVATLLDLDLGLESTLFFDGKPTIEDRSDGRGYLIQLEPRPETSALRPN